MAIERYDLEWKVLQRLREGLMDGVVGHESTFGDMTRRKFIEDESRSLVNILRIQSQPRTRS